MKTTNFIIKVTTIITSFIIFGDAFIPEREFSLLAQDKSINSQKVTNTLTARSKLECGKFCMTDPLCTGFALAVDLKCLLSQTYPLATDFLTTSDPGYKVYANTCRTKKTVHLGNARTISFKNSSNRYVRIIWINYSGQDLNLVRVLAPGQLHNENSSQGHVFIARDETTQQQILIGGNCQYVVPANQINPVEITNDF